MPQPRFTSVLFDCDGTLLNTIGDLAYAGNLVCEAHGWPKHSVDAFKRMVGDGQRVLVSRFVPVEVNDDAAALEGVYQEFVCAYDAHKNDTTGPYEGILECVKALREAGVQVGVLTNKNHEQAVPLVARAFGDVFDAVQGRVDGMEAKPEPPMTRKLMEALGADPARTLMVGDTAVDISCGKNVSVATCGVTWGFRTRDELKTAGADHIVDTPGQLAAWILGASR